MFSIGSIGKKKGKAKRGFKIIIVGCGKVGATIAEQLYKEGHDITLIDKQREKFEELTNMYDVMGIQGNGASYSVQTEAGVQSADLVIAVTDSDELNLLCCTVAKRVGNCATIARVRMPDYSEDVVQLKEQLGLAMIINPELEAANEIVRVLNLPVALTVNPFVHGQVEMIRFKIPEKNRLNGQKIMTLGKNISGEILICAVEREKEVFIPSGNFKLQQGDIVSFISTVKAAKNFFEKIGMENKPVHHAMIIGGGKAAYYLSKILLDMGIDVKVIEKDRRRCDELSVLVPNANIIYGDGTEEELLKEESIAHVDAVMPLTGIDEQNILLTLHAREVSEAKVITKVNRSAFHNLVDKLEIGSVINPKHITAEAIISYVRARQASMDSTNVETMHQILDAQAEAIEFRVRGKSVVTDIPLKDLELKDNLLVACINRSGTIIIPGGLDVIKENDTVVVVTTHQGFQNLEDILK